MEYAAFVEVYDRLAATDSTIEKRDVLAAAFADAGDLLPRLVTLVRGRLGPAYDRPDLGVSSKLTLEAVLKATDASEEVVRERWRESGDLGDAAAWAVGQGGQQTLFAEPLTVERVHDRLLYLTGRGSRAREARAAESTHSRDCSPTGRGGRPTRPPPSAG
ncbi:hypothetical protein ACFQE8_07235 [Salinirubellus sp. GCM10025818]|uniref:hypothetical protein n=1 Tax=Salinirubellus TaxID=2162630 RepID=UPI0030CEC243